MNLYVWNAPYPVKYGGSVLYAVAATEDEARELAQRAPISHHGYEPGLISSPHQFKLGKPDRVLPAPCAEIAHWEE